MRAGEPPSPETSPTELEIIRLIRRTVERSPAERVETGIGDDTAVLLPQPGARLLATTDLLVEDVHFRRSWARPFDIGWKAMAVNLSDMAAMAGQPVAAVVSVGLPRQGGRALAEELYLGLREVADAFDTAVVGGDTNSWDGPLVISAAIIGEATGCRPVGRAGARPDDWLLVTGPLGGSILGKHLTFTPRVREAIKLHALTDLHAMIDISDGLAADVNHICEESRCGAVLHSEAIPISEAAHVIQDGRSALEHALTDGEDFELVFAVAPADAKKLLEAQPIPGITLCHIGECVREGLWLEENQKWRRLEPGGYVHSFD